MHQQSHQRLLIIRIAADVREHEEGGERSVAADSTVCFAAADSAAP
jgi:hypothetical protein